MRYWIALTLSTTLSFALASDALGGESGLAQMVNTSCVDCHGEDASQRGLNLASVVAEPIESHSEVWEKVVRRLRGRQMPPVGEERPSEETYVAALSQLETVLDRAAAQWPNPGRTDTIRRLTRAEYQN